MPHPEPKCARCETLPDAGPATGVLYLSAPLGHTAHKLRQAVEGVYPVRADASGYLEVRVDAPDDRFGDAVRQALTAAELDDVRALFLAPGETPQVRHILGATSLVAWLARQRGHWLADMVREERLVSHFQPIVAAADTARVHGYECLLRGVDGDRLAYPGEILEIAGNADMLFAVDLAARRTAIREAARFGLTATCWINFCPSAIYDANFCLQSTARAIRESGLRSDQIVFEVTESDHVADKRHLKSILDFYRAHGFGVALDDIGSGYSSLNLLHQLRPDYVKLDMELIRGVDRDPYKAVIARKLLETARELGIRTVAEGVETDGELEWARANGADFVQGYRIARPASPPPLPEALR